MEIERKFRIEGDPHSAFTPLENGEHFTEKSSVAFTDDYYDFVDHRLGLQDAWLRKRQRHDLSGHHQWELKHANATDDSSTPIEARRRTHVTAYLETINTDEIANVIRYVLVTELNLTP